MKKEITEREIIRRLVAKNVMKLAWAHAKAAAARYNNPAREYFSMALKQSWLQAPELTANITEERELDRKNKAWEAANTDADGYTRWAA